MLHAHLMIRANDRSLKKAPNAFITVGVNVAMHPFLFGVVDCAMVGVLVLDAAITRMLVGVDVYRVRGRRFVNEVVEHFFINPFQGFDPNRAVERKKGTGTRTVYGQPAALTVGEALLVSRVKSIFIPKSPQWAK